MFQCKIEKSLLKLQSNYLLLVIEMKAKEG